MSVSRAEALAAAGKLLRTFASAPDPKQRAHAICAELTRSDGWAPRERELIDGLHGWLQAYPSSGALRQRCEQVLASLR